MPSDVATLAGVDLNAAKAGLVNLANLVGGDLEVSKDGKVAYAMAYAIIVVVIFRPFRYLLRVSSPGKTHTNIFMCLSPLLSHEKNADGSCRYSFKVSALFQPLIQVSSPREAKVSVSLLKKSTLNTWADSARVV